MDYDGDLKYFISKRCLEHGHIIIINGDYYKVEEHIKENIVYLRKRRIKDYLYVCSRLPEIEQRNLKIDEYLKNLNKK